MRRRAPQRTATISLSIFRRNETPCDRALRIATQLNVILMTDRPAFQLSVEVSTLTDFWKDRAEITFPEISKVLSSVRKSGLPGFAKKLCENNRV